MSFRIALNRLWHHGRFVVRSFVKKLPNQEMAGPPPRDKILPLRGTDLRASRGGVPALQSQFEAARRLLVEGVLRRVTNSLSGDLRKRTTQRLLFSGNATPFFALVGVSLASGTGIITREEQLEAVSWEIREAVSRMQRSLMDAESGPVELNDEASLDRFTIGPLLAKGANGVVYAARETPRDQGENCVVSTGECLRVRTEEPLLKFPFALKMMFNYHAESNALTIFRAMIRETVPARLHYAEALETDNHLKNMFESTVSLPQHPNVVSMHCAFIDSVPLLPGSVESYPQALPLRLNPEGDGRNMSLFLLMKRYDTNLKSYLSDGGAAGMAPREAVLLLAQLLEAVCHINSHGVAHRDLKSDNILLETAEGGGSCPSLVVTDFGCCLADRSAALVMPYRTYDTDKGGNPALMAPEVVLAEPGLFSSINYSKSDAWAAGAIAYELFCGYNPFYKTSENPNPLRSSDYNESDLPKLPEQVPGVIERVVAALLARSPSRRLSAEMAATVCHLYLWAPSIWLKPLTIEPLPSSNEILQWLLCLATKVLCQTREVVGRRRSVAEYQLIASFLTRTRIATVKSALAWVQRG